MVQILGLHWFGEIPVIYMGRPQMVEDTELERFIRLLQQVYLHLFMIRLTGGTGRILNLNSVLG